MARQHFFFFPGNLKNADQMKQSNQQPTTDSKHINSKKQWV
jgi:hypothetical protein